MSSEFDTSRGLMITGTGTGVGKTLVATALALALRERGRGALYFKPVESGVETEADSDTDNMAAALGGRDQVRRMAAMRLPLAPLAAAEMEGAEPITVESLDRAFDQAAKDAADGVLLVEGAGGLSVPMCLAADAPGGIVTYAGLAARWNLPLLIVADAALGTLNHTVLTVAYARAAGLRVAGIAINNFPMMFAPEDAWTEDEMLSDQNLDILFSVSLGRLSRAPLSADELRAALRRIPQAQQGEAAFSNPAMLSFLTQERIVSIIPRLPANPFPNMAQQAAPYLSPAMDSLIHV